MQYDYSDNPATPRSPSPSPSLSPTPGPMRIAVTGALGLVGVQLCHHLLSLHHSVVAIDVLPASAPQHQIDPLNTKGYKYVQGSAEDIDGYREACRGCTGIVHLAAVYTRKERPVPDYRIHNANVAMSYNTLCIAVELGINRVVLASSVNAIGMLYCNRPKFDYLPLDEDHPCRPEEPYSVSKYLGELQADSFIRHYPSSPLRIASLRFHGVVPAHLCSPAALHELGGAWKDLWGWVSNPGVARACELALTVGEDSFPGGRHEVFFIVAPTICQQRATQGILEEFYGEYKEGEEGRGTIRGEGRGGRGMEGNEGLFDCGKAGRMLGWVEEGFALGSEGKV
ncbi:hypothetical protein B9479_005498 [Cryptococcus floricola]|uniref:NAD-dependent epimerase/dehydratase domain-containing protein n=1 Tax=Cryptococcus floricola TaxID=2591691 RepID=A0A5D3AVN2_9TREE|nr:hypothetical protein B9479_005498 [Cryptococcus floricola]